MGAIQTEYGGSNPVALSEYYSACTNVAVSGTITMASFLGTTKLTATAQVLARNGYDFGAFSANCTAIHYPSNGVCVVVGSAGAYTWLLGGAASDYEIRYTKTGTSALSFSTGMSNNTFIGLGTERRVWLRATSIGYYTSAASVSIRYASNGTIIMTATHSFIAEVKK
jgi:hypothetical protein